MRRAFSLAIVAMFIAGLVISACGPGATPGKTLQGDNTVKIKLAEPVRFNEPVAVTITVQVEKEFPEFEIYLLTHDPDAIIEGERKWTIHAYAHHPVSVTSSVRFTREGDFEVMAQTHDPTLGGWVLAGHQYVRITRAGGTVNPPPDRLPGTPGGLIRVTPLSSIPTPLAPPTPPDKPTPSPPSTPQVMVVNANPALNLPIPDNGAWVTCTIPITAALPGATVIGVSVRFDITHPRAQDLVMELVGPDKTTVYRVWDRKTPTRDDFEWSIRKTPLPETTPGPLIPSASQLAVFNGQPVNGNWTLRVRDEAPGEAGTWLNASLVVNYLRPTSGQVVPPHLLAGKSLMGAQAAAQGDWQIITTEDFEGEWPVFSPGWYVRDLNWDGYERYWDDDDYLAHYGTWAAWPARGGADGLDPRYFYYPNNMDTRMIYGPFDLSDAVMADTDFYLWREIEAQDHLVFEVSHDGVTFEPKVYWSGSSGWEFQDVYYNNYVGDNTVWIAWRFYSNSSGFDDGPFVDDIRIWKKTAGDVTASGYFYYYDRDDNLVPARFTRVRLYDAAVGGGGYELGATTTDASGRWTIGPILNQDEPGQFTLDLYAVVELDVNDSLSSRRRVTDFGDQTYRWYTQTFYDVPDGTVDFGGLAISNGDVQEAAMWIFQDMRRGWEHTRHNPDTDPGSSTARWERNKDSLAPCANECFWPFPPVNGMFIPDVRKSSADIVVHELGHQYMYNASGLWVDLSCLGPHQLFERRGQLCAWAEGWADFLSLAVNVDPCYDWGMGPCGARGGAFENLEIPTWPVPPDQRPTGDAVEGRVAGALYDLFDSADDGYDQTNFGFTPIWNIVHTAPAEYSLADFWNRWKANGNPKHRAVQAIYQNTIDYDTAPIIANLPDCIVLQNLTWNDAIDLWQYSFDPESFDWELTWQIVNTTDPRCGAGVDTLGNIDLAPQPGWLGSCDVTVRVCDGIKTGDDTFTVNVVLVRGRAYLPLILKNGGAQAQSTQPGRTSFISPLATLQAQPSPFRSPLPTPTQSSSFVSPLPTPASP